MEVIRYLKCLAVGSLAIAAPLGRPTSSPSMAEPTATLTKPLLFPAWLRVSDLQLQRPAIGRSAPMAAYGIRPQAHRFFLTVAQQLAPAVWVLRALEPTFCTRPGLAKFVWPVSLARPIQLISFIFLKVSSRLVNP